MEHYLRLMLVTHRQHMPLLEYLDFIKKCATWGITSLQLREKEASFEFLLEFGRKLKEILSPLNIPLIINDNVDLAKELDAEGVHLGNSDGDPSFARQMLGSEKIIGLSIESKQDLQVANQLEGKYYVAASSVFETQNKNNLKTIWGLTGLKDLSSHSIHPLIAIGGVNERNAHAVLNAGASGIAVIGAIHEAIDPQKATQALRKTLNEYFMQGASHV